MRSIRRWLLFPLAIGLTLSAALAQPEPPVVSVPVCDQPPRIDGALDDACWATAYVSDSFYAFELDGGDFAPNADTTVRVTTDASWLYFGLECRHPTSADMKASVTENYGGRVFGDECIKFFIDPGLEGGGNFRYVLNFRNVYTLRRSFAAAAATPSLVWPSATSVTDHGWTAEVAVPLFYMAGYADLSRFRLNVFRKKIIKEYDAHHVEVGFKEFISTWAATDEWLNLDEMVRLEGLDELQLISPFVANADHVKIGPLHEADGGIAYDVTMTLMAMTGKEGQVEIEVIQKPLDGEPSHTFETLMLGPAQVKQASVTVPVHNLGQREIEVVVRNAATGMPFQTVQIADTSGFRMLSALARRSYYTSEPTAAVDYKIGMPVEALVKLRVVVRDEAGVELARVDSPIARGELPLPLADITDGAHTLALALEGADGHMISQVQFELVKRPPKPGCEWKIDRRTGSLLYDGEPFFPLGFLAGLDDTQYAEIADAGFNTVVWWVDMDVPFEDAVEMAARHGLKIMVRPQKTESRADEMQTLKRCFEGKDYERAVYGCRSMIGLKSFLLGPLAGRLTRTQRNEISAEFFDLHIPGILDNVRAIRDMPALLGYDTLDEPIFSTADQGVDLRRMYLAVKRVDPYHPMHTLYSSSIPPGPEATSFGDCLGTDPYWTPGRTLPRGSINWMSQTTARTVARALAVGQHPWTVPQSSLWSDVIKRMLTGPEQICQSYLALIHGTKSLLWFTHGWVVQQGQWDALKTVAAHVAKLTPALTAENPLQQISYEPGNWDPIKGELPDVQARLLRFPDDGRWVLIAANVRRSAVEVSVGIEGLKDTQARDMFTGQIGPINDGAFTDTMQARGTRAWVFNRIETDGPVNISIKITALGDQGPIEDGYRHEGRVGMKNILPNASFEEATVEGFPDYYWPFDWSAGRIGWRHRVGTVHASLILVDGDAWDGERFMRINSYDPEIAVGLFLRAVAPQHVAPQPYVFSFYARTAGPEPVAVKIKAYGHTLPDVMIEGPEWTRHHVQLEVPAHADSHSWLLIRASSQVDLDALQFEQGREPTEFQP